MPRKSIPRAKVRLRLDRGTALIKALGVETLSCELADISEGGCQCRILFSQVSEETGAAWKALLVPGRILSLEITEPAELNGFMVPEAEIRWVRSPRPGEVLFGVLLRGLEPTHSQLLTNSLVSFASKKLRGRKGPEPEQSAPDVAVKPAAPAPQRSVSKRLRTFTSSSAAQTGEPRPAPARSRGFETIPQPPAPYANPATATRSSQLMNADRQKRFNAGFQVFFHYTDMREKKLDETLYEGRVIDFNEGGFLIEAGPPRFCEIEQLDSKTRMLATVMIPGAELASKLQILSVKPGNAKGLHHFGVKILAMPEEDRARLRDLYIRESLTTITRRRR